ncbi:MAG: hypothetical protein LQ343_001656 [Gyalolechia ehrenbergii]|nr:MAG: hypothetical protein LQ343_001656 [Gyalolechia ehrenbergii]
MEVTQASHGLGDPRLLEIIDKLVELNIGDSVALPQLLVVGDQSSGKSSVLEGLTGLPFPRDSALCTRFATQITFRRASSTAIHVSIIPDKSTSKEDAVRLKAWGKTGLRSFTREDFSQILEEVHRAMGIGVSSLGIKKSFSDDVLKIEVSGPDQQHLSVVDVPGIFRAVTEGVTTQIDITNVRAMVERYMENSRSIILAVIAASVDIANQEILDIAQTYDPKGQRTLGVLTKPDLVDKGAEGNALDLMRGTTHKLNLGWSMVKNPSQRELKMEGKLDRHALEQAFFKSQAPWSTLDKDKVGVHSLRLRLVELLTEIVRREFNHVRMDVMLNLQDCERKLAAMGPYRETRVQQHRYLLDLATKFQGMTTQALDSHYEHDDIFDVKPSLRLATAVVDRNASFSNDVWHHGHTMEFTRGLGSDEEGLSSKEATADSESSNAMVKTRYHVVSNDLDDILVNEQVRAGPEKGIMEWLENVYRSFRGFEMGTFHTSLMPIMWKKQSAKWDKLALGYASDIVSITHTYICDLLKEICEDDRVRGGLLSIMMDQLTERYKRAIDHTRFILQVERTPMTANHYFADNLEKCNGQRARALLQKHAFNDNQNNHIVRLSDLDHTASMNNEESNVQRLHDILVSYYKVARKRFVDNVCMQAADYHLVRGPDTAVKIFSPSFVSDLTPEQLERIAGEDALTKRKRADLSRKVENLKRAKNLLVAV